MRKERITENELKLKREKRKMKLKSGGKRRMEKRVRKGARGRLDVG